MQAYEYRIVSAPRRGAKARGARTPEDRFAGAVEAEVNRMAAEGWEYVRSDTLPHEERPRWFSAKATVMRSLLVFRRALASAEPRLGGPVSAPLSAPVNAPPPPAMAAFPDVPPSRPVERAAPAAPAVRSPARPVVPPMVAPSPTPPPPQAGFRRPVQVQALMPEPAMEPPPLVRPSDRLPLEDLLPTPELGRNDRGGEL